MQYYDVRYNYWEEEEKKKEQKKEEEEEEEEKEAEEEKEWEEEEEGVARSAHALARQKKAPAIIARQPCEQRHTALRFSCEPNPSLASSMPLSST